VPTFVILGRVLMFGCGLVAFALTVWLTTRSPAILESIFVPALLAVGAIVVVSAVLQAGATRWMQRIGLKNEGPVAQPLPFLFTRCLLAAAAGYLFALWYLRLIAR
jgi:hypothetical protein